MKKPTLSKAFLVSMKRSVTVYLLYLLVTFANGNIETEPKTNSYGRIVPQLKEGGYVDIVVAIGKTTEGMFADDADRLRYYTQVLYMFR